MLNYQIITVAYPEGTVIALTEYYLRHWYRIEQPFDAILQFDAFDRQLRELLAAGATQFGFTVLESGKTQFTVHIAATRLTAKKRIRAGS